MNDTDACLWHLWLRINHVLRVMLHTRWNAEAWSQVRVEFRRALGFTHRTKIVDLANQHHLPTMYGLKVFAEGGG